MSSAFITTHLQSFSHSVQRFRYAEFLIKCIPAICLAFVAYLLLGGWLW